MCSSIPLEAAVKQGVLKDARTEPELKVVAVSQILFAEIVILGFAMDGKICLGAQIVKDLYICFFGSSEKASAATRSSKRWSRQVIGKGFMFGFEVIQFGKKEISRPDITKAINELRYPIS
ncbi:hypothetical protein V6N13_005356 [Hibiscus sabdariffa]|uniref:Uncharacterized protein n=1 Tax=Hibiscus sabdariffa TaxID=183260 RepID=A0ABR2EQY9_9ROSI